MFRRRLSHEPITCRYLCYRLPNDKVILLPLIQIELVSETDSVNTTALLDSGATSSFIQYEIAEILGLVPQTPRLIDVETAGGASQFFPAKLKRLSVLAGGRIFSDFLKVLVLVPINRERDLPYSILGRDFFFRRFYITFQERKQKFKLVHHKYAK